MLLMSEVHLEIHQASDVVECTNIRRPPGTFYFLLCWRCSWSPGFMVLIGISFDLDMPPTSFGGQRLIWLQMLQMLQVP